VEARHDNELAFGPVIAVQFLAGVVVQMVTERLEVRLDPERRRKLSELAEGQAAPVSEVVRRLIDRAYEDALRQRRRLAAKRLAEIEAEDVPDPETLSRQLEGVYDTVIS
jgi:hypothetical protein